MTARSGVITSFINTVPDKVMVTDRILMLDPYDIATYTLFGTDIGKFNFKNVNEKQYEWLTDSMNDNTDSVATGMASSSTTTTCTISTAALFQPGDVWLFESEQVWVSAISSSVITITRGFNGTTKATHANSTACTRVSRARIDADDADDSPSTEVASVTNVTQIFQRTIKVARTKQNSAEYGIASWRDYLIDKAMKELMMDLAKLPFYGKVSAGTGNTVARSCGGFLSLIDNNITYATSTAATGGTALGLTRDHIDDTLQNIHADGGDPNLILTGAWAQRKINDMYEQYVSTQRSEDLGGVLIKQLMNPISGRTLDVVVDRNCPTNHMWILEKGDIAFYPFDPFFYEDLAKDGDYSVGEVVGEYGFVVGKNQHHGAVREFSTSA